MKGFWKKMRPLKETRASRRCRYEIMEPRRMLDANPLLLGAVYTEQDLGTDEHADTLEITFAGGAPHSEITRLIIDGDQIGNFGNIPGFSSGDVFFDTRPGGLGVDEAMGLQPAPFIVSSHVQDGGTQLIVDLANFRAGDKLLLRIDVDEAEVFNPNETDLDTINAGFDPIASGAEFAGSFLRAEVAAPHYRDAAGSASFVNAYDGEFAQATAVGLTLDLPSDNENLNRDRTAGALVEIQQTPLPVTLSGAVYYDRDADLSLDAADGDVGIAGVQLQLWQMDPSGQFAPATTTGDPFTPIVASTDSMGRYEFGESYDLAPGIYQVREIQPASYLSVGASPGLVAGIPSGAADGPDVLTGIAIPLGGQNSIQNDFAETRPASIAGFVYHDQDDDGVRDLSEAGIAGVLVQVFDQQDQLLASQITGADGAYRFENLGPGAYSIRESQPADWIDGKDSVGWLHREGQGVVSSGVVQPDAFDAITLLAAESAVEYNFGERRGTIAGHVFSDRDGDCHFDQNELGIEGVTIRLVDSLGREYLTQTNAAGAYTFGNLPPGDYTLVESQPDGYFDGGQRVGNGGGDASQPNRISAISLGSGDAIHLTEYNFCEELGQIGGRVFHDVNDNGQWDSDTEALIEGVEIQLVTPSGSTRAATTDANGQYQFADLGPGAYSIIELQPSGWIDGRESLGTVDGAPVGVIEPDRFVQVELGSPGTPGAGRIGQDYDFGERLGSIAGIVHADVNKDCIADADELRLENVTIHLLDSRGRLVQTTTTNAAGEYRFDGVGPGEYLVSEKQPDGYFQGGQVAGSHGGDIAFEDVIGGVILNDSAVTLTGYNFCEHPPSSLSGYVFVDGSPIETEDGKVPDKIRHYRDGVRTSDDKPLAGVLLQLRDGINGEPIDASEALPGQYPAGPIQTMTDANGHYVFAGIRGDASYAVFEIQPEGYFDGIDTAGTTTGLALNPEDNISASILGRLSSDPRGDAIILIPLRIDEASEENNFSEIQVTWAPPPPPPPPPVPPPPKRFFESARPVAAPDFLFAPAPQTTRIPLFGTGGAVEYNWHLSIINAGNPRGQLPEDGGLNSKPLEVHTNAPQHWQASLDMGAWTKLRVQGNRVVMMGESTFGLAEARPFAGDFDGDGISEIGVFLNGEWWIDLDGNGRWSEGDLWARLGNEEDAPAVGDWDGDGKEDIAIFGPTWDGDPRAIAHEPGLPDVDNSVRRVAKNVPPELENATNGARLMQAGEHGRVRADLIDHVFAFGNSGQMPVAGDLNGDGVATIGSFRNGHWRFDADGDGRWNAERDHEFTFGQAGDVGLIGDFDGDGVDEVSVVRVDRWIIDSDGDRELTAHDRVFQLDALGGVPVVGDWDGDGVDEIGIYRAARHANPAQ